MADAAQKAKKWISENKDPRSAHWQAGLESVLYLFLPDMIKGRITPVGKMDRPDLDLFNAVLKKVDICPATYAAFLPKAVANAIVPPESAEEICRIDKGNDSCKIIILHKEKEENRIICAEISEQADRPGIDIFQSGAFLGNYDYENTEDCLNGLNKAVKAHAWEKGTWQKEQIIAYTLNWFERAQYLNSGEVSVNEAFSFFHSPTLIRTNQVDGLFQLIFSFFSRQYAAPDYLSENPELADKIKSRDSDFCRALAQNHILGLLNFIKDNKLMAFEKFTEGENKAFQTEFARTEEKLRDRLMHLKVIN